MKFSMFCLFCYIIQPTNHSQTLLQAPLTHITSTQQMHRAQSALRNSCQGNKPGLYCDKTIEENNQRCDVTL